MARAVAANIKDRSLVRGRREQLVKAATAVFLEKGYHDATVRDIGKRAGLTQGTIYNYVRSKSDILYLVCDHVVRAYHEAVARAVDGIADPSSRLFAALRATVEAMHAHQNEILLLYHESHALDRRSLRAILGRVAQFIDTLEALLGAARVKGRVAFGHRRLAANIVTFLPTIVALRRWDLRGRVSREEAVNGVTEFMLRGLGVTTGAPGNGLRGETARRAGRR